MKLLFFLLITCVFSSQISHIDILERGWFKYYALQDPLERAKGFTKNPTFMDQIGYPDAPADDFGPMKIPSGEHFFFILKISI